MPHLMIVRAIVNAKVRLVRLCACTRCFFVSFFFFCSEHALARRAVSCLGRLAFFIPASSLAVLACLACLAVHEPLAAALFALLCRSLPFLVARMTRVAS